MAERSIYAQIDEIRTVIESREQQFKRMRGPAASEEEEHIFRLKCVLRTLEWIRDHQDQLRQLTRKTSDPDNVSGGSR